MASWRLRFGAPDPKGLGPLAPYLGDPLRFPVKLSDGGLKWLGMVDEWGNPHWIAWKQAADDKSLYDWANLAKRNPEGSKLARGYFADIEKRAHQALGLDWHPEYAFGPEALYPPPTLYGTDPPLPNADWKPPGLAPLHVYHVWRGYPAQDLPWSAAFGPSIVHDLGPARSTTAADGTHRAVVVRLPIPAAQGRPAFYLVATINPWLRMGFLTGISGTVTGGATWIPEALETLYNAAKIVFGAYTGNFQLVATSAVNIVETWAAYAQKEGLAAAQAEARGQQAERASPFGQMGGAPAQSGGAGSTAPGGAAPVAGIGLALALLLLLL